MLKVLITGPESSGKSFLAEELASFYKGGLITEVARSYLNEKGSYQKEDLLKIARLQKSNENLMISLNKHAIMFCDTGTEVIKIWSQEKYGRVDPEINQLNREQSYDIVLLCKPNIPWKQDPLRENPHDRMRLFQLYINELKQTKSNFIVIDELIENRLSQAIRIIDSHLEP